MLKAGANIKIEILSDSDEEKNENDSITKQDNQNSEESVYLEACRNQHIVPVSLFLRILRTPHTQLHNITLSHHGLGQSGAIALAACLQVNSSIQSLSIDDNWINQEGAFAIANSLQSNTTLQMLDVSNNHIGTEGGNAFAKLLSTNSRLLVLKIASNKMGDTAGVNIANALQVNPTLSVLDCKDNEFTDKTGIAFGEALENGAKLKELDLGWNRIVKIGVQKIASGLKVNESLRSLSLNWSGVETATDLCNSLCNSTVSVLSELDLSHNFITESSCQAIASLISSSHPITRLLLRANPIAPAGVAVLVTAMESQQSNREIELPFSSVSDTIYSRYEKVINDHNKKKWGKYL